LNILTKLLCLRKRC